MYFETKVRYEKQLENGSFKKVTEPYLVDALTCTEAEARITEKLTPLYSDLSVTSVKQSKLSDIIFADGEAESEWYYLVKANFPTIDERTAQEKANISSILVQAASFDDAKNKFEDFMYDSMADWEYVSIALTPIIDVYRYGAKSEESYEPATDTKEA